MELFYLKRYKTEPVNRNVFMKKRKVIVSINDAFLAKLELDMAIETLPEKLRVPLILKIKYDMEMGDIAETLGVHRNTVTNRIKRALQILRSY